MRNQLGPCRALHLSFLFIFIALVCTAAEAAPPEGKVNDKDPQGKAVGHDKDSGGGGSVESGGGTNPAAGQDRVQQSEDRGNQGNQGNADAGDRGRALGQERAAEHRANKEKGVDRSDASASRGRSEETTVDRLHPHQERRNQTVGNERDARETRGRSDERAVRGREMARAHVDDLLKSLNKLEHARWSYNPHDTRGQGNMGKVDMRDPFGFDKDSGREGKERGRPIRETETPEPTFNLADLVSLDVTDPYLAMLQDSLAWWTSLDPSDPWFQWVSPWIDWAITWLEQAIATYQEPDYFRIGAWSDIDYALNFQPFQDLEGSSLLVTTQLVSTQDTTGGTWTINGQSGQWQWTTASVEAGQVVWEETQEVAFTGDGTTTLNMDLSGGIVQGFYDLVVTVTDPVSGQTYTMTYDTQLYVYADPYGIVYDSVTGRPIVGATVTIHNADGSIAQLDASANAKTSNPQRTDATGRYSCKLAVGKKYYLTVKAPGYAEYTSPLFTESGHLVREDVALTPLQRPVLSTPATLPELPVPARVVPAPAR